MELRAAAAACVLVAVAAAAAGRPPALLLRARRSTHGPARPLARPHPAAGKSAVVNALLGQRYLAEGILPTTNEINVLKHLDPEHVEGAAQARGVLSLSLSPGVQRPLQAPARCARRAGRNSLATRPPRRHLPCPPSHRVPTAGRRRRVHSVPPRRAA